MTEKVDAQGRTIIAVEDYPHIDADTEEGRDELALVAFRLAEGRTPVHFVFMRNGEPLGHMIVKAPFADLKQ